MLSRRDAESNRKKMTELGLTFPVVLSHGKRLFGAGAVPLGLKLVASKAYPTGVIVAKYQPEGAVRTGSFQLAEPSEAERERRRNLT